MNVLNEYKGTLEVTKDFYEIFRECVNKDPLRFYMSNVYYDSEERSFVATDGRRLIVHYLRDSWEELTIESGFYEPVKMGKKYKLIPVECDGQFPNWKRVLPNDLNYVKVFDDTCGITGNLEKDSRLICEIVKETGCFFNIEYLTKVLKHVPSFEVSREEDSPLNRALLFTIDDNTKYIIMPMQQ